MKIKPIDNTKNTQLSKRSNKNINFGWIDITPEPEFKHQKPKFKMLKFVLSDIMSTLKEKFNKIYKNIF